ncbi:MAG TPA: hypothetical protein VK736_12190 [Candidatus Binatia bacterium]|nr:hypothetical protein [Candidatus Binatia bacterium]
MHRAWPAPTLAAWLLLTTAALAGCTAGPSTDGGPSPPASGGSPTPAINGSSGPAVELLAGFPVIPGAAPEGLLPTDDPGLIARWSSEQVGPVVYDFYVDALPAAGYPTTGLYPGGAVAVIVLQTPSGARWELALTQGDGGGTRIELRSAQP